MSTLLIVHHSPTPKTAGLAETVVTAAREAAEAVNAEGGSIDVIEQNALEPDKEQLLNADAVVLGTTANFGYISGALKHYFDTLFYQVNEDKVGTPVSWWIRGGYDTTGAEKALRSIIGGLQWEIASQPVEFTGDIEPHEQELVDMAQAMVGQLV